MQIPVLCWDDPHYTPYPSEINIPSPSAAGAPTAEVIQRTAVNYFVYGIPSRHNPT
jgi:hypothetical protein